MVWGYCLFQVGRLAMPRTDKQDKVPHYFFMHIAIAKFGDFIGCRIVMITIEAIEHLSHGFPFKKKSHESFYDFIKPKFNEYVMLLEQIDETDLEYALKQGMKGNHTKSRFINLVKRIQNTSIEILECAYRGMIPQATKRLDKLLNGSDLNRWLGDWLINYFEFKISVPHSIFYRVVDFPSGEKLKYYHHVPFEKRHLSKNDRFNLTGYPCSYFSDSPQLALAEKGEKPKDSSRQIIQFELTDNHKYSQIAFIDFTLPKKQQISELNSYEQFCFLVTFPLKVLCLTTSTDSQGGSCGDIYKNEEYLFSQLFFHLLFFDDKFFNNYAGIAYSSMKGDGINYVLPAKMQKDRIQVDGYSDYLIKLFIQKEVEDI